MRAIVLAALTMPLMSFASHNACEELDGDCGKCPLLKPLSETATVKLSSEGALVANAKLADAIIANSSLAGGADIISFDKPASGLHTSLFYFCCHGVTQLLKMKAALKAMQWTSFLIEYDSFSCNNDHDNQTVFLHALPSDQSSLFAWATLVEAALRSAGVPVNHPRKSKFHMTIARVRPEYPTDTVVRHLETMRFGSHRLCSFEFAGTTIEAADYVTCKNQTGSAARAA
jgi:2'-5' RNA ligase